MCPPNDRRLDDNDEEKPRNSRRWVETPRKRKERDSDEPREGAERPRKSGRKEPRREWLDDDTEWDGESES